jgi:hypothetical protein
VSKLLRENGRGGGEREWERERERERDTDGDREGGREGGRDGGMEGWREGGRQGGKEGERVSACVCVLSLWQDVGPLVGRRKGRRKGESRTLMLWCLQAQLQRLWGSLSFNLVLLVLIVSNFVFTVEQALPSCSPPSTITHHRITQSFSTITLPP